jgi:hypothetical protein
MVWDILADDSSIERAAAALTANGIKVIVVENGTEAKKKVFEIIPKGAEVMTMSSVTLADIGMTKEILESGNYDAVKNKLGKMDPKTQGREMRKLGACPDWAIGSVHAVTEDGKVLIASKTGSQLPAYAYGAGKVIWVVGTQKIVRDEEDGRKRIKEYVLPLEDARSMKAYGAGSFISKELFINRENPGRITLILVKEKLGF